MQSPPGETNRLTYTGKGVTVVIAPWNFPLAIPCGMTSAALVAGNPVILKPAEQTPGIAWSLVEAFEAAGLPPGVLGFLPGLGEEVGARLVEHPDVSVIAFTGSLWLVGLGINAAVAVTRPGQRHVKRVIAEMGGKNPLIVDGDADPDQVVPIVVRSAFSYSGQKCSALSAAHRARCCVGDDVVAAARPCRAPELPIVGQAREMGYAGRAGHRGPRGPAVGWVVIGGAGDHGTVALAPATTCRISVGGSCRWPCRRRGCRRPPARPRGPRR